MRIHRLLSVMTVAAMFAQTSNAQVVARSGPYTVTTADLQELFVLDNCVLDTPLTSAEWQQSQENILGQFRAHPAQFSKNLADARKYVEILRNGSQSERLQLSTVLWGRWMGAAQSDASVARWVAVVKRHNPLLAQAGDLTVTRLQLNAMFASNDWVAQAAGLPMSTPEARLAYAQTLRAKFPSMARIDQEHLAHADQRWFALQDPILDHSDLRAKAIRIVNQQVHNAGDVPVEARSLEDEGLKFHVAMAEFAQHMAQIGGVGSAGKMNAESINFATRKFMGQGR